MLFSKPKPTVTPEDQAWIEEAFLWFEHEYGRDYLKRIPIIEPTNQFFDRNFDQSEKDAEYILEKVCQWMDIKGVNINLYFFNDTPMEFTDEAVMARLSEDEEDQYDLGQYSEGGNNTFNIGIERSLLQDLEKLTATIAHELSHLILLGEGRLDENNEPLTDLNCIVLGLGIFLSNSIFSFQQWHGTSHHGWFTTRGHYIPEQVAAYAMALFQTYQGGSDEWIKYLDSGVKKMYLKNMKYIKANRQNIPFLNPFV